MADQKTLAMDKLHFYVRQAYKMLPRYLQEVETLTTHLLGDGTLDLMKNAVEETSYGTAKTPAEEESSSKEEEDASVGGGGTVPARVKTRWMTATLRENGVETASPTVS